MTRGSFREGEGRTETMLNEHIWSTWSIKEQQFFVVTEKLLKRPLELTLSPFKAKFSSQKSII